jgi:signal recognition particle subunit SEC65
MRGVAYFSLMASSSACFSITLATLRDSYRRFGRSKPVITTLGVFNPRLDRPENLVRHRGTKVTSKGEIISKFEAQTFDIGRMNTTIHFFYDISRQDREFRRVTTSMTIKLMTYQEMAEVLDHCGFAMEAVYGDYSFSPYRKNSELMAFVARKL